VFVQRRIHRDRLLDAVSRRNLLPRECIVADRVPGRQLLRSRSSRAVDVPCRDLLGRGEFDVHTMRPRHVRSGARGIIVRRVPGRFVRRRGRDVVRTVRSGNVLVGRGRIVRPVPDRHRAEHEWRGDVRRLPEWDEHVDHRFRDVRTVRSWSRRGIDDVEHVRRV
jgi:hypothetical protein